MSSRFIHIEACVRISSFLKLNIPLCIYSTLYLLIHQRTLGLLPHFYYWIMLPWTSVCKYRSASIPAFNSFGHISRSGIAGSQGNFEFNFLRDVCLFLTADLSHHVFPMPPILWLQDSAQDEHRALHWEGTSNAKKAGSEGLRHGFHSPYIFPLMQHFLKVMIFCVRVPVLSEKM